MEWITISYILFCFLLTFLSLYVRVQWYRFNCQYDLIKQTLYLSECMTRVLLMGSAVSRSPSSNRKQQQNLERRRDGTISSDCWEKGWNNQKCLLDLSGPTTLNKPFARLPSLWLYSVSDSMISLLSFFFGYISLFYK